MRHVLSKLPYLIGALLFVGFSWFWLTNDHEERGVEFYGSARLAEGSLSDYLQKHPLRLDVEPEPPNPWLVFKGQDVRQVLLILERDGEISQDDGDRILVDNASVAQADQLHLIWKGLTPVFHSDLVDRVTREMRDQDDAKARAGGESPSAIK